MWKFTREATVFQASGPQITFLKIQNETISVVLMQGRYAKFQVSAVFIFVRGSGTKAPTGK